MIGLCLPHPNPRIPLERDEVERWRRVTTAGHRQETMELATVMGVMVEDVGEGG